MTKPDQKQVERHYMDAFLDVMNFRDVVVEQKCPPMPDFALRIGHLLVGVEMTEYHSESTTPSGHPRRLVEQEWERLRKAVMKAIDACPELEGVHGTLCFKDLKLPGRRESDSFIAQAIACAKRSVSCASRSINVLDFTDYPLLQTFLSKLRLRRIKCSMSWDWNHNTAWVGTDQDAFLSCVQRKTANTYDLNGLDQTWLLIVSGSSLSQAMGIELQHQLPQITKADEALRSSLFCRAFVFQYMFDVAYEWPGWRKIGAENFKQEEAHP